ncbi:hypothetical protein NLJ89_g3519 [Agrocybe chaxingu]|uniref:TECPR1-like DysF domain-containing protein n=1 Tax=Agrocybe chaxingu TaxID=84603 RepID=A0A9W8K2B6_9AGAR|nr:hypothetical protein NLJ89_g3519 [Agrocybe chaxingu]
MTSTFVQSPANISDFPVFVSPPPPPLLQHDPEGLFLARQKLLPKSRLARLFSKTNLRSSSSPDLARHKATSSRRSSIANAQLQEEIDPLSVDTNDIQIKLDSSALGGEDDVYTDRYEWAVVYENQRGATVFSIPYYSSLSLLPSDPSPFTLPNASLKRSKQPPISLENYPLPDGNWRWVSRCWMIDMRSDSGEVQHDGFEYNWMFRQHNWRAQVGSFNAGGWVRRRRWIRLMVRPAKPHKEDSDGFETPSTTSFKASEPKRHRHSMASSFPPSIGMGATNVTDQLAQLDPDNVWLGDDVEADWQRCRAIMKRIGRDGRKLDLWRLWLGFYHPEHKDKFVGDESTRRREKQWTEDEEPLPSEVVASDILSREAVAIAPKHRITAVLREHGQQILHLFVFPDSRAQLLKLLGQVGLLPEVNTGLGIGFGSTEVEFWSYASGLGELDGADKLLTTSMSAARLGSESPSKRSVATT